MSIFKAVISKRRQQTEVPLGLPAAHTVILNENIAAGEVSFSLCCLLEAPSPGLRAL